jgi:hypothetical protein
MILQILLKYWKNVAIILLAIFCVLSVRTCSVNKQDKEALETSVGILEAQVKEYKGKNGELVSQVQTHELTIAQLKDYGSKLGFENSSLKKQVGKLNNLVGYWRVQASVRDTFTMVSTDTVYLKDNKPVKAKAFHYSNNYLVLDQLYHPDDGTMSTLYDYKIDLELTVYRKGKSLFNSGTLVSDIRFKDQNLSVTEMKGVVIREPKKAWWQTGAAKLVFGLGLGYIIGTQ